MSLRAANIFIDEFGNTAMNVEKVGTFSHFVYCSVIIDENNREKAECIRAKLASDFRLGPNIKSKNISDKNFNKRIKILRALVDSLEFTVDVLVIDKSKLDFSGGFKDKRIFYKYFQNFFVKKYNNRFNAFSIWADKVGESFQFELQNYIRDKSISPDLFNQNRFYYQADDILQEKLIQLADLVCGSLGKVFCTSHAHERAQEIYEILHSRLSVEFFPFVTPIDETNIFFNSPHDKEIIEINLKIAADHLHMLRTKDKHEELRLLDYLTLCFRVNSSRLVPTHEISTYLNQFFKGITDDKVRTLVRNLRYDGVFVISHPGKPGYKLASSYYDITQQFQHYLRYVIPMLKKVKILNSSIAQQTINSINILETDNSFKELKQMIEGVK